MRANKLRGAAVLALVCAVFLSLYMPVQAQAVQRAARQWMAAQGLAIVYSQPQAKEKADGREG